NAPLTSGLEVQVLRARRVTLEADGSLRDLLTHAQRPEEILRECGLGLGANDQIRVDGAPWSAERPLPATEAPAERPSARLTLRRAVPIEVTVDGSRATLLTAAANVGEALRGEGILVYLGDLVRPSLGTPVSAGLQVYIEHSVPLGIQMDGQTVQTRTREQTVAQALAAEGVHLVGQDYVLPGLDAAVEPGLKVRVVRVREAFDVEQETIPFESVWEPDPELELDQQRLDHPGQVGLIKHRYKAVYEDDQLLDRSLEEVWVDQEPETRRVAYGTKIVTRELETPEGTVRYWRKVRVLATSYTAATSGKSRDHPQYGVTYLGWNMRAGIVAVDPTVIPMHTGVYVPGYGNGVAGDTGGAIKGRRIDLGYEEHQLALWYRWVDVYLLEPAPPRSQIRYVLPNWPVERR
ncbi:MAG: DUF348 domain-containing protein, partial [Chloroflexi bacterium]|nr:DUF348 domain-containing protein [Chloroflexota bacterium]